MKAAGFSPRFSPERQDPPNEQSEVKPASVGPEKRTSLRDRSFLVTLVGGLFFFSGFAALVYQVVWMRHLSLFFGSDVYAVAITLSVFMGGLSLGSWLAEKFVDRLERPLVLYGGIEIGIGAYAFIFQWLLHAFAPMLLGIYRSSFESAPLAYQATRVGVAVAVLLLPTTLMGATLPLIVSGFVRRDSELGRFGGWFYALNTLGALAGTLAGAFLLIPWQGIARTTLIAVSINFAVGVSVAAIGVRVRLPKSDAEQTTEPGSMAWRHDPTVVRWALLGIAVSGMAALGLEVVWTRLLTLLFSATVYSFALMLASFLFGIYYGSRRASRTIDAHPNPVRCFADLELGLGVSVALLAVLTYIAPAVFTILIWGLTRVAGNNFAFGSIAAQLFVGGLLIVVPTILLGATFPAAVRICTPGAERAGSGAARVYAANTGGAIAGSLLAGFVLIPAFGSRNSLVMLAALFLVNGLLLLRCAGQRCFWRDPRALLCVGVTVVAAAGGLALPHQTVANYGLQKSAHPTLLYHGEGVAHSVDVVRAPNQNVIMMVDGNTEADTSFIQRRHFILKGHLPLLLHPAPRDVAVVGLGLGVTLAATERNPEVAHIQVIELTPEMVLAQQHLEQITGGVLHSPKINVRIDDGRNFLAMTDRQFDMITADPIHPRISGVGYLYTEEYYRAIRQRLKSGGVVCQWMPMYNISRESFNVAFRTFARVFDNASFWYVRGHGLFVATSEPFEIDYGRLKERTAAPAVAEDLDSIEIKGPAGLLSHLLMGPAQIKRYLAASGEDKLNTDDNARLEYDTPFEFLHPTTEIVAALKPYAGFDPELLVGISDDERAEVNRAWQARQSHLLEELGEPLR
jgi:spermidine synthase